MARLAEGFEQGDQEREGFLAIDVGECPAGELDAERGLPGGWRIDDLGNDEGGPGLVIPVGAGPGLGAPRGKGGIFDPAMGSEGLATHAAIFEGSQNFSFVFRCVVGATGAVGFDNGEGRGCRCRFHRWEAYDTYAPDG